MLKDRLVHKKQDHNPENMGHLVQDLKNGESLNSLYAIGSLAVKRG